MLLFGIIILLSFWLFSINKNAKRLLLKFIEEKNETVQQLKVKEKQFVRTQLECDEMLTNFREKESEFEEKSKEIAQLRTDIKSLETQIEAYTQNIIEQERNNEKQLKQIKDRKHLNQLIIDDIIKLINKKLPGRDEYIELLKHIDGQYIHTLKNFHYGNLSVPYLKYCICFAIGMGIQEVSECFSIEQSSVHMVRYRLKKKFGLNNQEDFNVFLRSLNL